MALTFRKIGDTGTVVNYLVATIGDQLDRGQTVLWLVPGGSAIELAAAVSQGLTAHDTSKLTVSLTDERYGLVGHADSNWQQLGQAGFHIPGAQMQPVLTGADIAATTQAFASFTDAMLETADYRLGFFGIGPDGHTAGILPGSPAVDSPAAAVAYDGGQFQRITMTPAAIRQLDEAVVYAVG
jgi:6-phosphogluconolactonase/glucosamine-6-phosphate isomerase/deaminase